MRQKKKWGVLLAMILLAAACMPMTAFGRENAAGSGIQPMAAVISDQDADLAFKDQTADISAQMRGRPGGSSVHIALELQRYENGKWTVYESWSEGKAGRSMSVEKSVPVEPGTYRLVATFTAYYDGGSESATQEGSAVVCKQ